MSKLKIILVDDNEPFRKALKNLLVKEYNVEIIGEASNAKEFNAFENISLADIIFMDVMIPGTDGISITKKALWENSKLKIIAITMHIDKVYLDSLVCAGFKGCIYKSNLFEDLGKAIEAVLNNKFYFPKNISLSS